MRAKVEKLLVEGSGRKAKVIGVRLADGTEIRKEFRFQQDHYVIDVNFVVQNLN